MVLLRARLAAAARGGGSGALCLCPNGPTSSNLSAPLYLNVLLLLLGAALPEQGPKVRHSAVRAQSSGGRSGVKRFRGVHRLRPQVFTTKSHPADFTNALFLDTHV